MKLKRKVIASPTESSNCIENVLICHSLKCLFAFVVGDRSPPPSCDRCWESACWAAVRGDRLRTAGEWRRAVPAGVSWEWLHPPGFASDSGCGLVGPAQEASLLITPGFHWPAPLAPWSNRETNMASGPPGQLRFPRAAAVDTHPDRLAPPAPLGFSWSGQIFVWVRRSAVETLVNWSLVSWG